MAKKKEDKQVLDESFGEDDNYEEQEEVVPEEKKQPSRKIAYSKDEYKNQLKAIQNQLQSMEIQEQEEKLLTELPEWKDSIEKKFGIVERLLKKHHDRLNEISANVNILVEKK